MIFPIFGRFMNEAMLSLWPRDLLGGLDTHNQDTQWWFGDSYLLYRLHGYSALCHCIPVQISDVRILKNPPLCITVVGTGCTSRSPVVVLSTTDTYVGHVGGCFEIWTLFIDQITLCLVLQAGLHSKIDGLLR